jgi:hypothetical protein
VPPDFGSLPRLLTTTTNASESDALVLDVRPVSTCPQLIVLTFVEGADEGTIKNKKEI